MKARSSMQQLFEYAGKYKYLTISSWVLSALSALAALIPFYYIWKIIQEVLRVSPDISKAEGVSHYGWMAVLSATVSMLIYIGALMCSHIAAFHVQTKIRITAMEHILTLPLGFLDSEGTGRIR